MPLDGKQFRQGSVGSAQIADGGIAAVDLGAGVGQGFVPSSANVNMTGAVTAADGALATSTAVAAAFKGAVALDVNGVRYPIGDGVKTQPAYISNDSGATARAFGSIAVGDTIRWNGSVAGFQLAATDVLAIVGVA